MKKQENMVGIEVLIAATVGAGGSVLASLVLSAFVAKLVSQEITNVSSIDMMVVGTLVLASIIGALLACGMSARPRLLVCAVTGVVFYLMLVACNGLLFGGVYHALGGTAIAIFGGCGAVVLMGIKGEKRAAYNRRAKKLNWKVVQK